MIKWCGKSFTIVVVAIAVVTRAQVGPPMHIAKSRSQELDET
jgi:hypothetical protein